MFLNETHKKIAPKKYSENSIKFYLQTRKIHTKKKEYPFNLINLKIIWCFLVFNFFPYSSSPHTTRHDTRKF
jgi:hypothetical protein